mgnify:CR=1 FL=1
MRQELLNLYAIQKIDLGIRDIQNRLEGLPERRDTLQQEVSSLQAQIAKLQQERDAVDSEVKTLEGNVDTEKHRIRKWEKRLNEIRNQREYLALSREIEGAKRGVQETEERVLGFIEQRDAYDKQLEELRDRLAEQEVDLQEESSRVDSQTAELQETLTKEQKRREELVPSISQRVYRIYDTVRKKRFGVGIVPVVSGSCQGCNMKLPPQLFNTLQRVDSIEQCPTCQRLIFWEGILPKEEEQAAEQPEGAGASP